MGKGGKKGGRSTTSSKSKSSSSSSKSKKPQKGSCKHRSTCHAGSVMSVVSESQCKRCDGGVGCSDTPKRVCLGCGQCFCSGHVKKHWASSKTDRHTLFFSLAQDEQDGEEGEVSCFTCDKKFQPDEGSELENCVTIIEDVLLLGTMATKKNEKKAKQEVKEQHHDDDETESSSSSFVPIATPGKVISGLTNLGNTCFFNACLQSLASLECLVNDHIARRKRCPGPVCASLCSTLTSMWNGASGKRCQNPKDLFRLLEKGVPTLRGGHQHDAHEALRGLLDLVDTEYEKRKRGDPDNWVRKLFMYEMDGFVTCHHCQVTHRRQDALFDLSVALCSAKAKNKKKKKQKEEAKEEEVEVPFEILPELPQFLGKKFPAFFEAPLPFYCDNQTKAATTDEEQVTLGLRKTEDGAYDVRTSNSNDCAFLAEYTSPELLSGSNKYRCRKCNTLRDASKQMLFRSLPPVLVIHHKRFGQDDRNMLVKLNDAVADLNLTMDVAPFCSPLSQPTSTTYQLCAIVEHMGSSIRHGHYVAYTRHFNQWNLISDGSVRSCSTSSALTSEAYICFYVRC